MICWICGRRLVQAVTGKPVPGVEIMVDGTAVRAHQGCAKKERHAAESERLAQFNQQRAREVVP